MEWLGIGFGSLFLYRLYIVMSWEISPKSIKNKQKQNKYR